MIQITIDQRTSQNIEKYVLRKVDQLDAVISPNAKTEIAKAIFSITAKRFLKDLATAARSDPRKYHHLYEWNKIGSDPSRLFIMKASSVKYGNLKIVFVPVKSRIPVPISKTLATPGPTYKSVSARHIFRDKMEIMESGKPVHIMTKKTIVFSPDNNELVFVPKNHIVNIVNPGGKQTTGALREFSNIWYASKAEIVVKQSMLFKKISKRVAEIMNEKGTTKNNVIEAIKEVSNAYSKGVTEL